MTLSKAIQVLQALLAADADCRCGNFNLDDETREALKVLVETAEDAVWRVE